MKQTDAGMGPIENDVVSRPHDEVIVSPPQQSWIGGVLNSFIARRDIQIYTVLVAFLLVGAAVGNSMTQRGQQSDAKAAIGQASISLYPAVGSLPPSREAQLWVTASQPFLFFQTKITFDRSLVKLASEIQTTNAVLNRVIKKTPMSEANETGVISLVLAADPTGISNLPTSTVQVALLKFDVNTAAANATAQIPVNATESQIVGMDAVPFTVTTTGSVFSLNPISPTATLTTTMPPTVSPTKSPTVTPTLFLTHSPTLTPKLSPTTSPILTPTPTPPVVPSEEIGVLSAVLRRAFWRLKILDIKVTDSLSPDATLTVSGFGKLKYSSDMNVYWGKFYTYKNPSTVTITSSLGASIIIPLTQ